MPVAAKSEFVSPANLMQRKIDQAHFHKPFRARGDQRRFVVVQRSGDMGARAPLAYSPHRIGGEVLVVPNRLQRSPEIVVGFIEGEPSGRDQLIECRGRKILLKPAGAR